MCSVYLSQIYYVLNGSHGRMVKGYRQVSLPESFYGDIEIFLKKHPELGFTSVAEFVKASVREKIEKWKKDNSRHGND